MLKIQSAQTNEQTLEYALALDKIIMGKFSMLDDRGRSDELSHARGDARARDLATTRFEQDKAGFIQTVFDRSEKFILTGERAEAAKARATKMLKLARHGKMAEQVSKKRHLDDLIAHGPARDVHCQGEWVNVGPHDNYTPKLRPVVVRIMHRAWKLSPGLNKNVPEVFAARYDQIKRGQEETAAREAVMKGDEDSIMEAGKLDRALRGVDRAYGLRERASIEVQ